MHLRSKPSRLQLIRRAAGLVVALILAPGPLRAAPVAGFTDRFADVNNRITIPSYWRYDAMAHYQLNEHVDLQLNLQNLTDERYVTNPYQTHMAQIAPGRSALFTVNVRY